MGKHSIEEPINSDLGSVEEDNQATALRSLDRFELAVNGKPEASVNSLPSASNGDEV